MKKAAALLLLAACAAPDAARATIGFEATLWT